MGVLALAGAAGVLVALALWPSDERRVAEAAASLVAATDAGPDELARALARFAAPDVSLTADELEAPLVGRAALVGELQRAASAGALPRLRLEAVEVRVDGTRARLTAELVLAVKAEVPELRRPRPVVAIFIRDSRDFRLVSAQVGSERRDQPEARP